MFSDEYMKPVASTASIQLSEWFSKRGPQPVESASAGNLLPAATPDLLNQTLWRRSPETCVEWALQVIHLPESGNHRVLLYDRKSRVEQAGLVLWLSDAIEDPSSFSLPLLTSLAYDFHLRGCKLYSRCHIWIPGREKGWIQNEWSLYEQKSFPDILYLLPAWQ